MNANWKADSKSSFAKRHVQDRPRRGFTLTELLVVLATLAILAALLVPALAGTQPRSKAFQCLNNMRQLALAWTLYAAENNERLAINSDPAAHNGSAFFPTPNGSSPSWVIGVLSWAPAQANTNTAYLVNDADSLLGGYLGRNYEVFACPAEVYFVSALQRTFGWNHRVRSVAMDASVGDGYKFPFGWSPWYIARNTTDLNNPGPSQTWVFIDEHPDSIDDELFYVSPYPTTSLTEVPGNLHDGAAGMTFGDGHAEMHHWTGALVPNLAVKYSVQQRLTCSATDPDMVWLAQHTPQPQ